MSVYVCGANSGLTHLELVEFEMLEWGSYVPEQRRLSSVEIWERWKPLNLQLHGLRRKGARIQDVYQIGYFGGMGLVVSDRCRVAIDDRFPESCTFLPVMVTNARTDFFALWANCVRDDSLNLDDSEITYGIGGLRSVERYSFCEEKLAGQGVFRLSPCFAGVDDLGTQAFVDLVGDCGLNGFVFWDRGVRKRSKQPE